MKKTYLAINPDVWQVLKNAFTKYFLAFDMLTRHTVMDSKQKFAQPI
jgi:hypothetical protein